MKTEQTAGHTPIPWMVHIMTGHVVGRPPDPGSCNPVIAHMAESGRPEADADHIVHCVNSHAALVEQNRRLREALQKSVAFLEMRERGGDHSLAMKATVATARAALGGS